jgi:hypothetical protein
MKRLSFIPMTAVLLLATKTLAGTLSVNGSLAVATNVTTPSLTLGGVTQTNWPTTFPAGVVLTNGVLDTSLSQSYAITLTNNVAWTFQNHSTGRVFWLKVLQNATGGWTNSWDPNVIWPNHVAPLTGTNANSWDHCCPKQSDFGQTTAVFRPVFISLRLVSG